MKAAHRLVAYATIALVAGCASQRPPRAPQTADTPGMFLVREGRFTMGWDDGDLNERPAHKVALDTFAIDRTEVSAADFAEFLNGVGNPDEIYFTPNDYATVVLVVGAGGDVRFTARPGLEKFPANNVSWKGADAYCRWLGKRLPTEAEWEKAARGTDKRRFPWGKSPPGPGTAQFGQIWQEKRFGVLVPVDALPEGASPYGLLNMSGNVLEWISDWYRQNLCDFCNPDGERNVPLILQLTGQGDSAGAGTQTGNPTGQEAAEQGAPRQRQVPTRDNPSGPSTGVFKVLRGGSWLDIEDLELSTSHRFWLDPNQRLPFVGFRCATEPAPPPSPAPGTAKP